MRSGYRISLYAKSLPLSQIWLFSASRRLKTLDSPIESRDAESVWSPRSLPKSGLPHAPEQFVWRRKAFDRNRQVCIRTSYPRDQCPNGGKNFLEVDAIAF